MMNSRERVIAVLTFNKPDRAPRDLWPLPYISLFRKDELEVLLDKYPMDIEIINTDSEQAQADEKATAQAGMYTDDWGSVWQVAEPGVIGEVRTPILEDWSDLATFSPPGMCFAGATCYMSNVLVKRATNSCFPTSALVPLSGCNSCGAPRTCSSISGMANLSYTNCWKWYMNFIWRIFAAGANLMWMGFS